jgi:hypothetical protein
MLRKIPGASLNPILTLILAALIAVPAFAADDYKGSYLIDQYQQALENQSDALRNVAMEVHMEGRIPKLKKEGKMSALRKISALGKITYKVVGFWGDDTVKKEVMARYMTAEVEAASKAEVEAASKEEQPAKKSKSRSIAITPENYQFKYKGLTERDRQKVHVFELKPRHKRVGLFKGELWLDPETCLPVHESGRLVKNPSIFVKKMEFVRDYEIIDGVSYLKRMETKTETRLVGRAELNIEYANIQKESELCPGEPVAELRTQ